MKKRILFLLIACWVAIGSASGQTLSDVPENLGDFSAPFSLKWTLVPSNFSDPFIHYYFTLTTPMDIVVSHCESTLNGTTGIFLSDSEGIVWASNVGSYDHCIDGHAYVVASCLPPGTYRLDIDWQTDVKGNVHTHLQGLHPSIIRAADKIRYCYDSFDFADTQDTSNPDVGYRGDDIYSGALCYGIELLRRMDITISHCGSEVEDTRIYLLDEAGNNIMDEVGVPQDGSCGHPEHVYLKRLNVPAGTYYVVSRGDVRKGKITTRVMGTPTVAVRPITEFAENVGKIGQDNPLFVYEDTRDTNNPDVGYQGYDCYRNGVCYQFALLDMMDVEISTCDSELPGTSLYLLDKNGNQLAYNDYYSGINACDNHSHAHLEIHSLAAGTYYVVAVGDSGEKGGLTTRILCKVLEKPIGSVDKNYVRTRTFRDAYGATWCDKVDYFDAMGRQEETVLAEASPLEEDITSLTEYDAFGRVARRWLPTEIWSSQGGGVYVLPEQLKKSIKSFNCNDSAPYLLTEYEQSPLDRPLKEYGAGEDWHSKGKAATTQYRMTNVSGNTELNCVDIRLDRTVANTDTLVSFVLERNFPTGSLEVVRMTDEDGNAVFEFKNRFGQTVLHRQIDDSGAYDTYYLYDEWGNLHAVLPPVLSDFMRYPGSRWSNAADEEIRQYAYLYKYDARFRMIAKRLPGQGWIRYVYDKSDHPVLTQDCKQRKRGEWTFSVTDRLGRVCLTGICRNHFALSQSSLDTVVNAVRDDLSGLYKGYSISGILLMNAEVLKVNYYDDYNFMGKNGFPSSSDADYGYEPLSGYGERRQNGAASLLTGTLTAHRDSSGVETLEYLPSVMYYDYRGRMIQSKSSSHLSGGIEKEYVGYDFTGHPLKRRYVHADSGQSPFTEEYSYTYDHMGRLNYMTHSLNGGQEMVLADNIYDGLGRLSSHLRGKSSRLESWYGYDVRSQPTSVNGFLFNQKLYYNEQRTPDGTNRPCYNGNISGMDWSVASDNVIRGYDYTYNCLSWLKSASYLEGGIRKPGCFDTSYTYNKNGNLTGLKRYGQTNEDGYGLIDDLRIRHYGYQLKSVSDSAPFSACHDGFEFKDGSSSEVEYGYDENGNLTKDLNKNIVDIQYNYLNLPCRVEFENGNSISYLYDANGTKLRTTHVIGNDTTVTDYCGNLIYENGVAKTLLVEGGYVSLSDRKYHFYFQDHQGNNRVIADENGNIEEVNHYYPFGGTFASTPSVQPYKYNGKELDRKGGLDWYDYGARMYDAALGRWHTVDPLSEKYYGVSPYNYCLNNPLKYIDSDGRQVIPVPVPAPLPVYYPVTSTNYRYPTTYEVKQAVNNGLNSVVDFVKSCFTLGVLTTVSIVISADHAISPEYKHQRNRERREKRELDQNQANVAKSIDTNVSGMMPNGDPAPKRDPNDGGKKTIVAIGALTAGSAAAVIQSIDEGTRLSVKMPETSSNKEEIKEPQKNNNWLQTIIDLFK